MLNIVQVIIFDFKIKLIMSIYWVTSDKPQIVYDINLDDEQEIIIKTANGIYVAEWLPGDSYVKVRAESRTPIKFNYTQEYSNPFHSRM